MQKITVENRVKTFAYSFFKDYKAILEPLVISLQLIRLKCRTDRSSRYGVLYRHCQVVWVIFISAVFFSVRGHADTGLQEMSLLELLEQPVKLHTQSRTASTTEQSLLNAPAAMVVLEQKDFERRGYTGLNEILADLPGFDAIDTGGTMKMVAYQRGYRTPWLQRTLFLIDGRVDNNLWNHSAQLSRQYPISQIKRVEVLYGPASAVYGPNAFLGVINVITHQGHELPEGEHEQTVTIEAGSYQTYALDGLVRGHTQSGFAYKLAARGFTSEEPGLDDLSAWGYTSEHLLRDPKYWGSGIGEGTDPATGNPSPAGDIDLNGQIDSYERFNGQPLGSYSNNANNESVFAEVNYRGFSVGGSYWKTAEGYGPYYSFMDGQANGPWVTSGKQAYANYTFDNERWRTTTDVVWRSDYVSGEWAESFGGYVSLSDWYTDSEALRVEQQVDYTLSQNLVLSGGLKWEEKDLAKLYQICNYWDGAAVCQAQAENSSNGIGSDGSGVIYVDDISSLNPTPLSPPVGNSVPASNQLVTTDKAAFVQALWSQGRWQFNGGLRFDSNSEYGDVVTPRGAAIFHYNPKLTYKLIYGEAFQEPSAKDLYGGWNGRAANDQLEPEKAQNIEAIIMLRQEHWVHEASAYKAHYKKVIASGLNIGERDIHGFEYRGNFRYHNGITDYSKVTGHFYYTFTQSEADHHYNNVTEQWHYGWAEQGDISPHKVHLLVNVPISPKWNLNTKWGWYSSRDVFSENPLRQEFNSERTNNRRVPAYSKVDLALQFDHQPLLLTLGIDNLFEENYWHPGVESASSGDDFSIDADGFQNSLIPQVNRRSYTLTVKVEW